PSAIAAHAQTHHLAIRNWGQRSDALTSSLSQSQPHQTNHTGFPRLRNALLQQPYWPYTSSTHLERAALSDAASKTEEEKNKGSEESSTTDKADANLLNLSMEVDNEKEGVSSMLLKSLVRHQCPYCSYATLYPEVLWIHQRIAHKVDSTTNGLKGPKTLLDFKRRTGPPPFLEGKDCPSLPLMRTNRNLRQVAKSWHAATAPGASSHSSKHKTSKSRTDDRRPSKQFLAAYGKIVCYLKRDFILCSLANTNSQIRGAPKPMLLRPPEGLILKLRIHRPRLGLSGPQSTTDGQEPVTDILSFLKNCSPHDIAALYHHWGFNNAMTEQA
ncbi:hypothetical protein M9458_038394, partial [Cirrhinus mrigala]